MFDLKANFEDSPEIECEPWQEVPSTMFFGQGLPRSGVPFLTGVEGNVFALDFSESIKEFMDAAVRRFPLLAGDILDERGVIRSLIDEHRFDLRNELTPITHESQKGQTRKDIELVFLRKLALFHYRGVTLAPGNTAYDVGKKLASIISEIKAYNGRLVRVLEIGTGTGIISQSFLSHTKQVVDLLATDISAAALSVAEINAEINGNLDRVKLKKSDLYDELSGEPFDVIVSNPPFLPRKIVGDDGQVGELLDLGPSDSLQGGDDGLFFYRRIMEGAETHLASGGKFVFQVQPRSVQRVRSLAQKALGRRYKSAKVHSKNKIKKQPAAKGFLLEIDTHD